MKDQGLATPDILAQVETVYGVSSTPSSAVGWAPADEARRKHERSLSEGEGSSKTPAPGETGPWKEDPRAPSSGA